MADPSTAQSNYAYVTLICILAVLNVVSVLLAVSTSILMLRQRRGVSLCTCQDRTAQERRPMGRGGSMLPKAREFRAAQKHRLPPMPTPPPSKGLPKTPVTPRKAFQPALKSQLAHIAEDVAPPALSSPGFPQYPSVTGFSPLLSDRPSPLFARF
jgi:hypothetical protein